MKSLLTIFVLLINLNFASALDSKSTVDEAVVYVKNELASKNYALGAKANNIDLVYLKEWPAGIISALEEALQDDNFFIVDEDRLAVAIEFDDGVSDYSLSGTIYRSFEIELEKTKLYVAIYSVWGGEWSRETESKRYYIFDADESLLAKGQIQ